MEGMAVNIAYLDFMAKVPPLQRLGELDKQAIERVTKTVGVSAAKPHRFFQWQRWTLFAGAVLYVAGHGIQMASIPPAGKPLAQIAFPSTVIPQIASKPDIKQSPLPKPLKSSITAATGGK